MNQYNLNFKYQDSFNEENFFVSDSNNNWYSQIPIDVMGSLLSVNNSGYFQPGETTSLDISITYSGMLTASNITGYLEYNGTEIEVNDANGSWNNLETGQTGNSNNGLFPFICLFRINSSLFLLLFHAENVLKQSKQVV